jgi:ketosteroid isomerase-like protein
MIASATGDSAWICRLVLPRTECETPHMDVVDAARNWVQGWARGWAAHQPETIARLYTEDAMFVSHPFRDGLHGSAGAAEYAALAFADEDAVEFWFGEPVAAGDRAAVEYWAHIKAGDTDHTLAGITALAFASDGRCREHRDYWAMREGRVERAGGWSVPIVAHARRDLQADQDHGGPSG